MSFSQRLQSLLAHLEMSQKKLAKNTGIDQSTISRWHRTNKTPAEGSILKICRATGCSFDWLKYGKGEMRQGLPSTTQKSLGPTISLSHEKDTFTYSEMVTMTTKVLESDTVYTAALASNIRALYKAVLTEEEMKSVKAEMSEMRADIQELKELVLSLGAKLPEKRDKASNS